jgi:hypothetical protein
MENHNSSLLHLIDGVKILGLSNSDVQIAKDFLTLFLHMPMPITTL